MVIGAPEVGERTVQLVLSFEPHIVEISEQPLINAGLSPTFISPSREFSAGMLPSDRVFTPADDKTKSWLIESGLLHAGETSPVHHVPWNPKGRTRGEPGRPISDPIWQVAASREQLQSNLAEEIIPFFWPGATIKTFDNFATIYAPGEECVTVVDLQISTTVGIDKAKIIVTSKSATEFPPAELAAGERVFISPRQDYFASVFPTDAELPSLAAVLDGKVVTDSLCRSGVLNSEELDQLVDSKVLRYRPHERCVVSSTVSNPDGQFRFRYVCKVYDDPETAQDVMATLTEMRKSLDEPDLVVKPLSFDRANRIVVMEFVEGLTLGEMMDSTTDNGDMRKLTRIASSALAALHSVSFRHTRVKNFETEIQKLRDHSSALLAVAPDLAKEMEASLDEIESVGLHHVGTEPSFVHGGFKPTQIIVRNDAPTVLDFDGSCLGDPALDVGRFMAKLRFDSLDPARQHLKGLDRFFLESYAKESIRDVTARAGVYEAMALTRMTSRRFETSSASGGFGARIGGLHALLKEANACLEQTGKAS